MNRLLPVFALAALAAGAHAQLVFTTSASSGLSGAFALNIEAGTAKQLWTGAASQSRPTGLVVDGNGLFGAAGLREFRWQNGTIGTAPTQPNLFYRQGSDNVVYGTAFANLTRANGEIYGYTNFNTVGGSRVEDGIFAIDPTITTANVVNTRLLWRHDDLAYNFEGLAYNDADGLFYATNTAATNTVATAGLYSIDAFGAGTVTKVMDFDAYIPTATGLTFGGGKLWISGKATGSSLYRIASVDLTTRTLNDRIEIDGFGTGAQKTALVWAPNAAVPEPATLAALGLGAAALLRRRRA